MIADGAAGRSGAGAVRTWRPGGAAGGGRGARQLTRALIRALRIPLVAALAAAAPASAELHLFARVDFQGARMAVGNEEPSISFPARSAMVAAGERWTICPRPFFGGSCIELAAPAAKLRLPRAFSGTVRSARRLAQAPAERRPHTPDRPLTAPEDPPPAAPPPAPGDRD